jgi:hypothetical protein
MTVKSHNDRIEIIDQKSTQVGPVLVTTTFGRIRPSRSAAPESEVSLPVSDANDLDDVIRELGIEDSFTTPAEAVRALKAERDALMQDWQPIGTAPKDGTRILWCSDASTYSVIYWPEYRECFDEGWWQSLPAPPVVRTEPVGK